MSASVPTRDRHPGTTTWDGLAEERSHEEYVTAAEGKLTFFVPRALLTTVVLVVGNDNPRAFSRVRSGEGDHWFRRADPFDACRWLQEVFHCAQDDDPAITILAKDEMFHFYG
jgi:hypothetical protein